uniref:Uncharacterized protein n=1 Tax=Rattus norvegicus TaxID=10116 RepID=A0ABK0LI16_RAT
VSNTSSMLAETPHYWSHPGSSRG